MRLATYNIHHGAPARGPVDLDATLGVARALDADVLAVQELDRGQARSGHVDQPRALAEALDMAVGFVETVPGYGHALLSRQPLQVEAELPLDVTPGREARRALIASTVTPDGGRLVTITAHLENPRPGDPRPGVTHHQLTVLVDLLVDVSADGTPGVLLGDLNLPAPQVRATVAAHPRLELARGPATFPARRPRRRIDHVVTAGLGIRAVEVPAAQASDHRPLVVVVSRHPRSS